MIISPNDLLLFEGDSLTARKAAPAFDDWPFLRLMNRHRSYADVVQEWLFCNRPELNLRFRNSAVGGSSIRNVTSRFDSVIATLKPNWIIMTLGANDCAQKIPLEEFRRMASDYAKRCHECCGARIMIVGGLRPCPPELDMDRPHYAEVPNYYAALQEAIAPHDGMYLDAGKRLYTNALELKRQCDLHTIFSDGGHFNEVANQILATEIIRALGAIELPGITG